MNQMLINKGQHDGIPNGAVVETNAEFSSKGIKPVKAGRLPGEVENLVMQHVNNQNKLVSACLNRNKKDVFEVFLNDPLIHLKMNDTKRLFNEMFKMNESFWN